MNTIIETINTVNNLSSIVAGLSSASDPTAIVWNETPTGTINSSNTLFILSYTPLSDKLLVFINGVLQESHASTADFSLSGKNITFSIPPRTNSKILVTYTKTV